MSFLRHRRSFRPIGEEQNREPHGQVFVHGVASREQTGRPLPALIGADESQPAIPWRVGLHRSPPPLHRLPSACVTVVLPVEQFAANGNVGLNRLCQPRGQAQFRAKREFNWKEESWQPGFTEHRIRDDEDWQNHLAYIRMNPVRARLVDDCALYPYMNFFTEGLPQGLKPPPTQGDADVRAEARTLPHVGTAEAAPFQYLADGSPSALKGHDFRRAEKTAYPRMRALAPEREQR
jgi:hypothetical protein